MINVLTRILSKADEVLPSVSGKAWNYKLRIELIKEDVTKVLEYLAAGVRRMNIKIARRMIKMFEGLLDNDLRNVNGNSFYLYGTEALYIYRTLGLYDDLHNEFNKYVKRRETNKEFEVDGQTERIMHCYYATDRKARASEGGSYGQTYGREGDEFKMSSDGRYEWTEMRMGISFSIYVYQITLADELITRRREIMQRPVRSKWQFNEVNILAEVLHGIPSNMTCSHLTKDKKD
eukprot:scaffold2667_cov36-Cyclotella_meneghiniana.AAC.1